MTSFRASSPAWPKGRVAQIMGQGESLTQILVQSQRPANRPRDLRHFQCVGQTGAKIVAFVVDEHLGLVFEATEGPAMNDPVTVALKTPPCGAIRLIVQPPAAVVFMAGK